MIVILYYGNPNSDFFSIILMLGILLLDQAFASGEAWMPGPIQVSNLKSHIPIESTFAGPLNGGGVSAKELIKWIDERASSQPTNLRLLLGVLKVACQHYGKLRSANLNSGNSAVVGYNVMRFLLTMFDSTLIFIVRYRVCSNLVTSGMLIRIFLRLHCAVCLHLFSIQILT